MNIKLKWIYFISSYKNKNSIKNNDIVDNNNNSCDCSGGGGNSNKNIKYLLLCINLILINNFTYLLWKIFYIIF
jgi:hypothetical protein